MLAVGAGTYFLAREYTDWSPATAMMVGIAIGAFATVAAVAALMTLRYQLIKRGIPSFLTRDAMRAHGEFMAQAEADRKEIGLDKETKAFAETDVQEFARKLRELELSPEYMKASESERDRMMKEVADRHMKESEAKVHEEAARATERIEALRQYRELEARARRREALSPEDRERMQRLKRKAYSG